MQAYRVETTLTQNSGLVLNRLPFKAGEAVEVILLLKTPALAEDNLRPLRGLPVQYLQPFEPIASAEWEAGQ